MRIKDVVRNSMTLSRTSDANLDCGFVENALLFIFLILIIVIIGRLGPSCPPPLRPPAQTSSRVSCVPCFRSYLLPFYVIEWHTHSSTLKLFCSFWWWHCGEFTLFATTVWQGTSSHNIFKSHLLWLFNNTYFTTYLLTFNHQPSPQTKIFVIPKYIYGEVSRLK